MTVTLTSQELSKFAYDLGNWYNEMTCYVLTNMAANPDFEMRHWTKGGAEAFHRWCKRFQEEHPKPSWKDLLPE